MTPNEVADAAAGFICFMIAWGIMLSFGLIFTWQHNIPFAIITFIAAAFCGEQCNKLGHLLSARRR